MHQLLRLTAPALLVASLAACGDDPITYSQPVTINLKAKSDDVVNNALEDDKNITTESSNPYGKFITDATAALGGAQPSRISVAASSLTLGAGSRGVLKLGDVFNGNVEVNFTMADTNNTYPAAWGPIAAADGSGPIAFTVGFDTDGFNDADYVKMLGGNFKVGIRGPVAATFANANADADLQVTLTFSAFE